MASEMNMLLEKATSPFLLELDITFTLQIVDLIRQNDVSPKVAVQCIFNRLKDPNPNVVLMTLQVLDFVVKNCGEPIHEEVCSRAHCESLEELVMTNTNEDVRKSVCYLLGSWCAVFKGQPKLQAVQDVANILRAKGYHIPSCSEAAALYTASAAPEWADGNCCHRCRSNFTLLKRKHHCRACGEVFCNECSSRTSNIPKFGIEKEVRVCETCYQEINNPSQSTTNKQKAKDDSTISPAKSSLSTTTSSTAAAAAPPGGKTEAELQEEEELQLALALSKSEAENKEKEKLRLTNDLLSGAARRKQQNGDSIGGSAPPRSPSPTFKSNAPMSELDKYLNRQYWEQQKLGSSNNGSSKVIKDVDDDAITVMSPPPLSGIPAAIKTNEALQTNNDTEINDFVSTFRTQLEIFVNRMKSNQSRGRPIANDSSVQSLFVNLTAMHGQLLQHLTQQSNKRIWYERLQDKMSQTKDARAALEALREEHREKERREREEQQRIRQMQMMQKLEVMRKKKQEYLEYQRQLAVHRMAQTERQLMQQPGPYYGGPPGLMDPAAHMPQQAPMPGGGYPVPPYEATDSNPQPTTAAGPPPYMWQQQQQPPPGTNGGPGAAPPPVVSGAAPPPGVTIPPPHYAWQDAPQSTQQPTSLPPQQLPVTVPPPQQGGVSMAHQAPLTMTAQQPMSLQPMGGGMQQQQPMGMPQQQGPMSLGPQQPMAMPPQQVPPPSMISQQPPQEEQQAELISFD